MKERSTGTQSGLWPPMALMAHLQKTVQHRQNPARGGSTSIGYFEREVESHVATAIQLGGKFSFGSSIMEPILANGGETLASYLVMDAAHQRPYEDLYKDLVVTIIMLKNCGFESLRKRLSKQYMGPSAQAYLTVLNDLVDMMNSNNFEPDTFKPASKRNNQNKNGNKNKNKDEKEEEVVGAIVEPTTPIPDPPRNDDDNNTMY